MSETIKLAAKRGAAYLDQRYPRWEQVIALQDLDMTDPRVCVLGQVAASRDQSYSALTDLMDDEEVFALGFDLGGYDEDGELYAASLYEPEWEDLNAAWVEEITSRR